MGHYDLELIDHTYAIPVHVVKSQFPHIYEEKSQAEPGQKILVVGGGGKAGKVHVENLKI